MEMRIVSPCMECGIDPLELKMLAISPSELKRQPILNAVKLFRQSIWRTRVVIEREASLESEAFCKSYTQAGL